MEAAKMPKQSASKICRKPIDKVGKSNTKALDLTIPSMQPELGVDSPLRLQCIAQFLAGTF